MKSIICTLLLTIANTSYSQELDSTKQVTLKDSTSHLKNKTYVIDINTRSVDPSFGYLQSINNSTVGIISSPEPYGASANTKMVPYSYINDVSISRKGGVGRGVLYGALTGILFGGIVGAVSYSKPVHNNSSYNSGGWGNFTLDFGIGANIAAGSILGVLPGLLIGALIGGSKHHYTINKNKERFNEMRNKLVELYGVK